MTATLQEVEYVSTRGIPMRRVFAHASRNTFNIPAIRALVKTYLMNCKVSVDPFAGNKRWTTYTNDLNPDTRAESHTDAEEFLKDLISRGVVADLVIFDPPYSPRQISDCYKGIGLKVAMEDTQNAVLYSRVKRQIHRILRPGGLVISCGWNSTGMQNYQGYEIVEILFVCHGAGRNDTICTVERKIESAQVSMFPFNAESSA